MEWKQNMEIKSAPEIVDFKGTDFTCATFEPDLRRFGLTELTQDIVALMKKRVYDLAGLFNNQMKVFLNGERIKFSNFSQYVDMYLPNVDSSIKIYDQQMTNERWEVLVTFSNDEFRQVSFVNGICTWRGGTHVNHIVDKIVESISEQIQKQHKDLQVKPSHIQNNLWIFVNALIENPSFDSQTQETLTLKTSQFGSKCQLTQKFIKDILQAGVIDQIVAQAQAREKTQLAKTLNAGGKKAKLTGIPKLEDANEAGTQNSEKCTLILTEGDSAKALAMAGIEVVGRDYFGVFPLKGKLLNVREANNKQIGENQEIQNLIQIIGLQLDQKYENVQSLRYGSVMIMSDQDLDGSHIKGLIINFIQHFWPSLFEMEGFLKEFITPIIKATKKIEGRSRPTQVHTFFTIQDFKNWANGRNLKPYHIKYYKGLGTSTDLEAKQYFDAIDQHQIDFIYEGPQDVEAIDLCFNKQKADQRQNWLATFNPDVFVDHNIKEIKYSEFVNQEFIHYSNSDNLRSIPSVVDGFKPGHRKILFSCFKRNLKDEIKVAQLTGYVAEHSAYHHGEMSLAQTIIGMAQNFVGSNNINLLLPIGQFGTRSMGGKEHASSRYIHTSLSPITRAIFPQDDDHSLKYLEDDSQIVEPQYYVPIIPMVLVNGSEGIGTGWSSSIPCYNPREIVQNIKRRILGQPFENMTPWYKGFVGDIESDGQGGYIIQGKYQAIKSENKIIITQLPVGKWTKDYKLYLDELVSPSQGGPPEVEDFRENHKTNTVHFEILTTQGRIDQWGNGIEQKLKLSTTMQVSNMVCFDPQRKIQKYPSVVAILQEFFQTRKRFYDLRKDYLESKLLREIQILSNKMRFVIAVIKEDVQIRNVKKRDICTQLMSLNFVPMSQITQVQSTQIQSFAQEEKQKDQEDSDDDNENENDVEESQIRGPMVSATEFNYLLGMPLWSLTYEQVEQLKAEFSLKEKEMEALQQTTIYEMWTKDLDHFLEELGQIQQQEIDDYENIDQKLQVQGKALKAGQQKNVNGNTNPQDKDKDKDKNKDKEKQTNQIENKENKGITGAGGGGAGKKVDQGNKSVEDYFKKPSTSTQVKKMTQNTHIFQQYEFPDQKRSKKQNKFKYRYQILLIYLNSRSNRE